MIIIIIHHVKGQSHQARLTKRSAPPCQISRLSGKPIFGPLSKNNTSMAALCAGLPVISQLTYSLLLALPWKKLSNKSAMHAVISLLLQSRKFWWYLLLASTLRRDLIMTSFSVCLFTVSVNLVSVKLGHTAHVQQLNCGVKKRQTVLRPTHRLDAIQYGNTASKQPRSQSCRLRDLGYRAASSLPLTNP